jgi:hypothetical protein
MRAYVALHYQKTQLQKALNLINAQLRTMHTSLIQPQLEQQESKMVEIMPANEQEAATIGGYGSLQLAYTPCQEDVGVRKNLTRLCVNFYKHLFPTVAPEEVQNLGEAQVNWIWQNREKYTKCTVERIYVEEKQLEAQKRKAQRDLRTETLQKQTSQASQAETSEEVHPPARVVKHRRVHTASQQPSLPYTAEEFRQNALIQAVGDSLSAAHEE